MNEDGYDLVRRLHEEELERMRQESSSPRPPMDQVEEVNLPPAEPGSPIAAEWEIFRQGVAQLIRNGYRGKFALVKVGAPITVWDSLGDAAQAAQLLYGEAPSLVQQILPYLRPLSMGAYRPCRA